MSSKCNFINGVKQGGVLLPTIFAVYSDGLLKRLKDIGVGCHKGSCFTGAIPYAVDNTLLI